MSKIDAHAFVLLTELVEKGFTIQLTHTLGKHEVTVWKDASKMEHHHYQGESLLEAVLEAHEKSS